jgi:hypothetical protein
MQVYKPGQEPRGWKKQATEKYREIIEATSDGSTPAEHEFVMELIRLRTEPETLNRKLGGKNMANLIVRPEPGYGRNRQFAIVRDDGAVVGVSWVEACRAKWATDPEGYYRQEVLGAMRVAIKDQAIAAARAFAGARCDKCGAAGPLEADHFPVTFADIATEFTRRIGSWREVPTVESDDTWGSVLAAPTRAAWQAFHKERAAFRPLCIGCNLGLRGSATLFSISIRLSRTIVVATWHDAAGAETREGWPP